MHLLGHLGLHHLSIVRAGCTDGLLPEIGGLGVKVVAIMERRGGGHVLASIAILLLHFSIWKQKPQTETTLHHFNIGGRCTLALWLPFPSTSKVF